MVFDKLKLFRRRALLDFCVEVFVVVKNEEALDWKIFGVVCLSTTDMQDVLKK
jgi:hypothetical protein